METGKKSIKETRRVCFAVSLEESEFSDEVKIKKKRPIFNFFVAASDTNPEKSSTSAKGFNYKDWKWSEDEKKSSSKSQTVSEKDSNRSTLTNESENGLNEITDESSGRSFAEIEKISEDSSSVKIESGKNSLSKDDHSNSFVDSGFESKSDKNSFKSGFRSSIQIQLQI